MNNSTNQLDLSKYNEKINRLIKITDPESPFFIDYCAYKDIPYPKFTRQLWTNRQRQGHSLHEISYRACFKPELPNYFINKFTNKYDLVYDPFSGRGTTILEAALLGRRVISNDINPLSRALIEPRLNPPLITNISETLKKIPKSSTQKIAGDDERLLTFFHPDTLNEILSLKEFFLNKNEQLSPSERWIRMVAINRLTGHSPGFFSVYTLPPNQATTVERQKKINEKYNQAPEYRDTHALIIKKSRKLLSSLEEDDRNNLNLVNNNAIYLNNNAKYTPEIPDNCVNLIVTSPPFVDIVQYAQDNWMRCWFLGIDSNNVEKNMAISKNINEWSSTMESVFEELKRVLVPGGHIAFEVGEIKNRSIKLEEYILPIAAKMKFNIIGILINDCVFTKTSNIWGVSNNESGTNSNRIVLLQK